MTDPVPGPKGLPFLGNMLDMLDEEAPLRALEHLAQIYGPIYRLTRAGNTLFVISSVELMEEVCDETRFLKAPSAALAGNGDRPAGLFTARNEDPDWGQAHRTLMPAFGPLAIEGQFEGASSIFHDGRYSVTDTAVNVAEMQDIGNQLLMKWARLGPDTPISVTDDFTRLTLDTIALCAMDFRFNSFYQEKMHPFVDAMVGFLSESGKRIARPAVVNSFMTKTNAKLKADQEYMDRVSRELVQHRKDNPTNRKDILNSMIHGKDPQTGETMRDELIMANMITFLIAGMFRMDRDPGCVL
jgi:cytochrome P450/NADPH-cytochrome P450 reductase